MVIAAVEAEAAMKRRRVRIGRLLVMARSLIGGTTIGDRHKNCALA
jgi:hypothetical protein